MHATTPEDVARYKVEPYVMSADIASVMPHTGRGGWTWYSGAAAWAWRLGVEAILGLRRIEGKLHIDPCIPPSWGAFTATVRWPGESAGTLEIHVDDPTGSGHGIKEIRLDGKLLEGPLIPFPTDAKRHKLNIRL